METTIMGYVVTTTRVHSLKGNLLQGVSMRVTGTSRSLAQGKTINAFCVPHDLQVGASLFNDKFATPA